MTYSVFVTKSQQMYIQYCNSYICVHHGVHYNIHDSSIANLKHKNGTCL